jgi:hypothetical protein
VALVIAYLTTTTLNGFYDVEVLGTTDLTEHHITDDQFFEFDGSYGAKLS